ncbi:MAG: hypothetical protein JW730_01905 [Anaerolineales bacterium]|nr:hypothetical protein [Anaerolineales bacterium]
MIAALLITILVEGLIAAAYSIRREKPVQPILLTSICVNLITQSLLWIVLDLFFRHYLIVLLAAEIPIWMLESLLLHSIPANRLRFSDALLLSLGMNLGSFTLGWFLPI